MPDPTALLIAAARAYVEAYCPGRVGRLLKLQLDDGARVVLVVGPEPRPIRPTPADLAILQAVAELGDAPTGAEIARKAGYPHDSHLKMRLSLLRARRLLGGGRGEAGYPLTEAGAELLASEST